MDKKLGFGITRVKLDAYHSMKEAHAHSFYEIYYLVSGNRRFFVDHTLYSIKRGDAVLIRRGSIHRSTYQMDKAHERYVVKFSENFVEALFVQFGKETVLGCFQNPHISIPSSRREYVEGLLTQMEHEYKLSDDFSQYLLRSHLYELIIFFIRCQKYQYETPEEVSESDEVIQKAAQYICENYNTGITLGDAARQVNMSPTYFSRKFKKLTGFGFKEYLINIRLRAAETLLLETKLSITEIALRCGFNDSNYFGDAFKKERGLSPHQYRKNTGIV